MEGIHFVPQMPERQFFDQSLHWFQNEALKWQQFCQQNRKLQPKGILSHEWHVKVNSGCHLATRWWFLRGEFSCQIICPSGPRSLPEPTGFSWRLNWFHTVSRRIIGCQYVLKSSLFSMSCIASWGKHFLGNIFENEIFTDWKKWKKKIERSCPILFWLRLLLHLNVIFQEWFQFASVQFIPDFCNR